MAGTIKVTCNSAHLLPIESLSPFQGNLKSMTEKEFNKLKSSIERHGFSFPVFIWKSDKKNFIIDGHQRLLVMQKMVEQGWTLEGGKVPVDFIEARSLKEAKEKVLLSASQYGKVDMESLYEYITVEQLDFSSLKEEIDLPQIYIGAFEQGYFTDGEVENPEDAWRGMPEFANENKNAYRSIIVHFNDDRSVQKFADVLHLKVTDSTKFVWYPREKRKKVLGQIEYRGDGSTDES